jgi:hypothetical protein
VELEGRSWLTEDSPSDWLADADLVFRAGAEPSTCGIALTHLVRVAFPPRHKFLHFLPFLLLAHPSYFRPSAFRPFNLSSLSICSNNPALFPKACFLMTSSSKPSLPLSKVPSVRELCELLGFQQASLKDTNTFMEAARAWRKSYHTSSGRPATKILHWNQQSDQLDLEEMAQDFLDKRGGNGERFWSPDRSWNRDSDLQLPEDRAQ